MKKILILTAATSVLAACDGLDLNFNGQMTVHRTFTITEQYDPIACNNRVDWWNCQNKIVNVNAGVHSAEMILSQLGEDSVITLKLDGQKGQVVKMTGNKNVKIGNQFQISGADIKQTFDIKGSIDTKVSDTPEAQGIESCSETHYERRCHWERTGAARDGDRRDRRGEGRQVCEEVPVTEYGDQEVSYYYSTTVKDLVGQFVQGRDLLADVSGRNSNTKKIYTYRSSCHLHSRY